MLKPLFLTPLWRAFVCGWLIHFTKYYYVILRETSPRFGTSNDRALWRTGDSLPSRRDNCIAKHERLTLALGYGYVCKGYWVQNSIGKKLHRSQFRSLTKLSRHVRTWTYDYSFDCVGLWINRMMTMKPRLSLSSVDFGESVQRMDEVHAGRCTEDSSKHTATITNYHQRYGAREAVRTSWESCRKIRQLEILVECREKASQYATEVRLQAWIFVKLLRNDSGAVKNAWARLEFERILLYVVQKFYYCRIRKRDN